VTLELDFTKVDVPITAFLAYELWAKGIFVLTNAVSYFSSGTPVLT
jgi:hypothetical protein